MNPILVVALTAASSAPSAAPRPEPPARAALGGFVYFICRATDDTGGEANCAGPALLWAGIAGAGGAAVGAGVDALIDISFDTSFDRPALSSRRSFNVRVRF